jgi:hypothetical protein
MDEVGLERDHEYNGPLEHVMYIGAPTVTSMHIQWTISGVTATPHDTCHVHRCARAAASSWQVSRPLLTPATAQATTASCRELGTLTRCFRVCLIRISVCYVLVSITVSLLAADGCFPTAELARRRGGACAAATSVRRVVLFQQRP